MAEQYDYVTDKGIIVPDVSSTKDDVEQGYRDTFGGDIDLSSESVGGRLVERDTLLRNFCLGICALVANQINIDYATGEFLDAIGSFFGVERRGATKTRVLATLTGVSGTVIPANSQVKNDDGYVFYAENEITIPASGNTTGYFLSMDDGASPCTIGTLTTIISQYVGWETINNPAPAIIGSDMESDYSYRIRIKKSRYKGTSLVASIGSALSLVDNVQSSFVWSNGTGSNATYDGITVPPHSILIVVDGGTNSDVAQAIFEKISGGCGYTSITGQSVTVQVQDGFYGASYDVTFNRPDPIDFDIAIQVRSNQYTGSDLETDVKNAILKWAVGGVDGVDGLKIGQNVSPFEIAAAVSDVIPEIYVKSCLICSHGGTPAASELTYTISQVGTIKAENITVTVV